MRPRVNHLFPAPTVRGAIAGVLLATASASAQQPGPAPGLDARWIPSFAFTMGVDWTRQHAKVSSDCRAPGSDPPAATSCKPDVPEFGAQLRPGAVDDELTVTPYVGGNLSLSTPVLARPGRARLFAGVELPYQFGIDRNVAQKERPTGIREPDNPEAGEFLDEGAMLGAGSRTRTEVHGLAFGANAGAVFAFEAFRRQFRLRPSANWLHFQIGARGRVESVICIQFCDADGDLPGDPPDERPAPTRVITLKSHDSQWFDAVGGGLDLEMDTTRVGPYSVALFLGGAGYYLPGDRSQRFSATQTIGPDPVGAAVDYHADFSYRLSPWLWRAGIGMRFSWVGYD
jgi:hypothetical protein